MAAFRAQARAELDPLQKEQASIERRRQAERERHDRIFDVKWRTMGVRG